MDTLSGKTIIWTFDDGPMAGVKIEHAFGTDGSVTWTIADGPHQGASVREKAYGAVKVSDGVWLVSYLSASGHTLTVALNVPDGRVFAFGSDNTSWVGPMHGRFALAP